MKKNYFLVASIILLLLSIIAFSDNLLTDIGQESNSDPKFIIHGLFFLAWFVILVVQSNFIRKGNYRTHMNLGLWGMGIAIGVVLSTFYVFYAEFEGWSVMPGFVKANRILTLSFTIFVLLAYLKRKKPIEHKRLLYIGTLYVLGPIIGRVADKLGPGGDLSFIAFEFIIWTGLFISLLIYDKVTLKRIHGITWMGIIWFYIVWIFSIVH
ncbi:hypothetical protein KXJ69_05805 [Aureisphaera sp. CAU 1614]|uniref:Uncharacterized protein n=1 Tax=Halomarinibacterium sedimenti TaxID=2857106 RepID=A0A9X1FNC5_9FLAO|nr:hypothetical protein [Halomarinibacterium sedimenti]MBW2937611.1 hypothetical protein [Halomarinibacterium sedimenti]